MNVALHNLRAALLNARANKAIEITEARKRLAVVESEYALLTELLDKAEKEHSEEQKRLERKEVRTDGQRADEWDRMRERSTELENVLGTIYEYLNATLRPCDADCECVLHDVEKSLNKPDSRGKR
jgi:hypothetical protein